MMAVPGDVDLAVVVVPAPAVPTIMRDAAAKGVPAVVVSSAGFAESGPAGLRLQDELIAQQRAGRVRGGGRSPWPKRRRGGRSARAPLRR